jgi:hypothetical protein
MLFFKERVTTALLRRLETQIAALLLTWMKCSLRLTQPSSQKEVGDRLLNSVRFARTRPNSMPLRDRRIVYSHAWRWTVRRGTI